MMTYCHCLQNFQSNLLLMFLHLAVARIVILENVYNGTDSTQPFVVVAKRDMVQQLMLKPW